MTLAQLKAEAEELIKVEGPRKADAEHILALLDHLESQDKVFNTVATTLGRRIQEVETSYGETKAELNRLQQSKEFQGQATNLLDEMEKQRDRAEAAVAALLPLCGAAPDGDGTARQLAAQVLKLKELREEG